MKELDCIEVIVEKKKYTEDGVHKGMTGWICYDKCVDGYWLVNFPQYGDKPDIATISVHESDMVKIAALNVQINEQIRKQFEAPIVFLTAYSGESDKVIGFSVGADDYIVKPFNPMELKIRVKKIIS